MASKDDRKRSGPELTGGAYIPSVAGQKPAVTSKPEPSVTSKPEPPVATLKLDPGEVEATARNATIRTRVAPVALPVDRPTLVVVHGLNAGQVFTVENDVAVLGRSPEADFQIDDASISRKHCRFRKTEDRFFVEDLGSANGTFVGGRRLKELQLAELFAGDRVQVGPSVVLRFSLSDRFEEQLQRRLYESATRDALTGAYNKAYLLERLAIEIASARRHHQELSFLFLELDHWSEIAGTAGPPLAARLVQQISVRILRGLRVEDVFGRWGAERFAVVVRATNLAGANVLAERLRNGIEAVSIPGNTGALSTTASIGVACLAEVGPQGTEKELIALTEQRLAIAKRKGGNVTCSRS